MRATCKCRNLEKNKCVQPASAETLNAMPFALPASAETLNAMPFALSSVAETLKNHSPTAATSGVSCPSSAAARRQSGAHRP
jgi:hypothetical protein